MTPEELEKLPKPLERTMSALERSIMSEIIDRIKHTAEVTPLIDWKLNRLAAIGTSKKRIKQMISEALKATDQQVDEIYQRAVESDYVRNKELYQAVGQDYQPYEENTWLQQVVDTVKQQTKDSLRPMENITQTTGFNVMMGKKRVFTPLSEYLERSLDKSMMGIASGTHTYSQAINEVIQEMTNSGLRVVNYASGKSDRIEVAARRAVMTGVAQMTDKVSEKNAEDLGTDYYEVDWHLGARNTGTGYLNHQSWQGKVYSSEEMKTVCGQGAMLGFAGINCYHIKFPFIPGISKRKYTDEWLAEQNRRENEKKTYRGKEYDVYGALQYQRKLERLIRKQKQDIELLEKGGADKADITAAKCQLRLTNKTYTEFSKEMGLRQQRERLTIPKDTPLPKLGAGETSGNAPGSPEKIGEIPVENIDKAIEYYNEQIRNQDVEHAVIIDRNGNVYYSIGNENSVGVDGIDLNEAVLTHNHPSSNGIISFGKDDFELLKANQDINRLVAVNETYTYIVRAVKDMGELPYDRYYRRAMSEADITDAGFDLNHQVFEILKREGYVDYERKTAYPGTKK